MWQPQVRMKIDTLFAPNRANCACLGFFVCNPLQVYLPSSPVLSLWYQCSILPWVWGASEQIATMPFYLVLQMLDADDMGYKSSSTLGIVVLTLHFASSTIRNQTAKLKFADQVERTRDIIKATTISTTLLVVCRPKALWMSPNCETTPETSMASSTCSSF